MFDNFNSPNVDTTPSARNILIPFQEFTPMSPPPFNSIVDLPLPIQNALPEIAATTANQISKVAATSPVFCFLYNRVMMHGMRNKEWQKILEAVAYHTWYNIKSRKYPSEPAAMQDACKSVIMVYASYQAVQTNEMQYLLTVQQQNEVKELARRWPLFAEQYELLINEARQGRAAGHNNMGGGSFSQQQSISSAWARPGERQAVGAGASGLGSIAPSATYLAPGDDVESLMQSQRERSIYDEPEPTFRPTRREMFVPGVNDREVKPAPAPKMPPKASFLSHVTEITQGGIRHHDRNTDPIVTVTADRWQPSPYQPYHPAYRYYEEATYELQRDAHGFERVIAIISPKETEMDRSQHNFTSIASFFTSMSGSHADAEVSVQYALSATAKAILSGEVGENSEATELYKKLGVIENEPIDVPPQTSLRALVAEARAYQIASGSQELTFLVRSGIGSQVVSYTNHLDIIGDLRGMSLEKAAKYLTSLVGQIKETLDQSNMGKLQFVLGIDRAIKRELLNVIRFRMGLGSDFNFDSFMEDEEGIRTALQSVHGMSHTKAYLGVQSQLLPVMFDEAVVSVQPIDNGEDVEVGYTTSISPMVTLLLLNISDEQFGLQLPDGAVCEVFSDTFPGLHEFIKNVVQANPGVLHHYLVTNDDVVYEVNSGMVGFDKHMVLTRVTNLL